MRCACVPDHRELLSCVDQRRAGDRARRIVRAGEDIDIVLGQQLLHRDTRIGAGEIFGVASDQLDRVWLDLVGVELEVEIKTSIDLLRVLRAHAGIRQLNADLHLLRRCPGAGEDQGGRGCGDPSGHQTPRCGRQSHKTAVLLHVVNRLRVHH